MALGDPTLRIALTYFTAAQLLDVITTLAGLLRGLDELNPVTAVLLHNVGGFGLLLQKVPVVTMVALAVTFLPRRVAAITCWTLTVAMAAVIASNAGNILALRHI